MSKAIALMLLLSIILAIAQSEEIQYSQERLAIRIKETMIATDYDWLAFLGSSKRIGGADLAVRESRKWDFYKGGIKISEGEFYEIAGLKEYAKRANSLKADKRSYTYGGVGMMVAGIGIVLVDVLSILGGHVSRGPSTLTYVGLGVELVGLTFTTLGAIKPSKLTAANFAVGVADEYNKNLKKALEERR